MDLNDYDEEPLRKAGVRFAHDRSAVEKDVSVVHGVTGLVQPQRGSLKRAKETKLKETREENDKRKMAVDEPLSPASPPTLPPPSLTPSPPNNARKSLPSKSTPPPLAATFHDVTSKVDDEEEKGEEKAHEASTGVDGEDEREATLEQVLLQDIADMNENSAREQAYDNEAFTAIGIPRVKSAPQLDEPSTSITHHHGPTKKNKGKLNRRSIVSVSSLMSRLKPSPSLKLYIDKENKKEARRNSTFTSPNHSSPSASGRRSPSIAERFALLPDADGLTMNAPPPSRAEEEEGEEKRKNEAESQWDSSGSVSSDSTPAPDRMRVEVQGPRPQAGPVSPDVQIESKYGSDSDEDEDIRLTNQERELEIKRETQKEKESDHHSDDQLGVVFPDVGPLGRSKSEEPSSRTNLSSSDPNFRRSTADANPSRSQGFQPVRPPTFSLLKVTPPEFLPSDVYDVSDGDPSDREGDGDGPEGDDEVEPFFGFEESFEACYRFLYRYSFDNQSNLKFLSTPAYTDITALHLCLPMTDHQMNRTGKTRGAAGRNSRGASPYPFPLHLQPKDDEEEFVIDRTKPWYLTKYAAYTMLNVVSANLDDMVSSLFSHWHFRQLVLAFSRSAHVEAPVYLHVLRLLTRPNPLQPPSRSAQGTIIDLLLDPSNGCTHALNMLKTVRFGDMSVYPPSNSSFNNPGLQRASTPFPHDASHNHPTPPPLSGASSLSRTPASNHSTRSFHGPTPKLSSRGRPHLERGIGDRWNNKKELYRSMFGPVTRLPSFERTPSNILRKSRGQSQFIELLNLLSACALGRNRMVEGKLQNLMTMSRLTFLLNDRTSSVEVKSSVVKFLHNVYVSTGAPLSKLKEKEEDRLDHQTLHSILPGLLREVRTVMMYDVPRDKTAWDGVSVNSPSSPRSPSSPILPTPLSRHSSGVRRGDPHSNPSPLPSPSPSPSPTPSRRGVRFPGSPGAVSDNGGYDKAQAARIPFVFDVVMPFLVDAFSRLTYEVDPMEVRINNRKLQIPKVSRAQRVLSKILTGTAQCAQDILERPERLQDLLSFVGDDDENVGLLDPRYLGMRDVTSVPGGGRSPAVPDGDSDEDLSSSTPRKEDPSRLHASTSSSSIPGTQSFTAAPFSEESTVAELGYHCDASRAALPDLRAKVLIELLDFIENAGRWSLVSNQLARSVASGAHLLKLTLGMYGGHLRGLTEMRRTVKDLREQMANSRGGAAATGGVPSTRTAEDKKEEKDKERNEKGKEEQQEEEEEDVEEESDVVDVKVTEGEILMDIGDDLGSDTKHHTLQEKKERGVSFSQAENEREKSKEVKRQLLSREEEDENKSDTELTLSSSSSSFTLTTPKKPLSSSSPPLAEEDRKNSSESSGIASKPLLPRIKEQSEQEVVFAHSRSATMDGRRRNSATFHHTRTLSKMSGMSLDDALLELEKQKKKTQRADRKLSRRIKQGKVARAVKRVMSRPAAGLVEGRGVGALDRPYTYIQKEFPEFWTAVGVENERQWLVLMHVFRDKLNNALDHLTPYDPNLLLASQRHRKKKKPKAAGPSWWDKLCMWVCCRSLKKGQERGSGDGDEMGSRSTYGGPTSSNTTARSGVGLHAGPQRMRSTFRRSSTHHGNSSAGLGGGGGGGSSGGGSSRPSLYRDTSFSDGETLYRSAHNLAADLPSLDSAIGFQDIRGDKVSNAQLCYLLFVRINGFMSHSWSEWYWNDVTSPGTKVRMLRMFCFLLDPRGEEGHSHSHSSSSSSSPSGGSSSLSSSISTSSGLGHSAASSSAPSKHSRSSQRRRAKARNQLLKVQLALNELGSARVIMRLVVDNRNNVLIVENALRFANLLLQGGHSVVQNSLMRLFRRTTGKAFLLELRYRLRQFYFTLRSRREENGSLHFDMDRDLKEMKVVSLVVQFLQLCCEGHNRDMQNYLRYQTQEETDSPINLVADVLDLFIFFSEHLISMVQNHSDPVSNLLDPRNKNFYAVRSPHLIPCIELATHLLRTMTEFCQGTCQANQLLLSSGCDAVNRLLEALHVSRRPSFLDTTLLEKSAFQFLLSLMEGHSRLHILEQQLSSLDQDIVISILNYHWAEARHTRPVNEHGSHDLHHTSSLHGGGTLGGEEVEESPAELHLQIAVLIFTFLTILTERSSNLSTSDDHSVVAKNPLVTDEWFDRGEATTLSGSPSTLPSLLESWNLSAILSLQTRLNLWQTSTGMALRDEIGRVEFLRDGRLERVYFQLPRIFVEQRNNREVKAEQKQLLYSISRASPEDQLTDFIISMDRIIEVTEHESRLSNLNVARPVKAGLQAVRKGPWWKVCYLLTLIINVLLVAFAEHVPDSSSSSSTSTSTASWPRYGAAYEQQWEDDVPKSYILGDTATDSFSAESWIRLLGVLHLFFACLMVFKFGISRGYLLFRRMRTRVLRKSEEDRGHRGGGSSRGIGRSGTPIGGIGSYAKERDVAAASDGYMYMSFASSYTRRLHPSVQMWLNFIFSPIILYYSVFILCDFLGLLVDPFFFGVHLVDIVVHNFTLRYVMSAISKRPAQLLATMLFGLVIVYLFSILAFVWFQGEYTFGDSDLHYRCDTMLNCLQEHWDYGFREPPSWNDPHHTFIPTIYDLAFFFTANVLLVSLITGIIIDTFSEMRSKKDFIEEQVNNYCFICGIDRETFNFHGYGFDKHLLNDHWMWNYVYLRKHLQDKTSTEHTGQEQYLHQMFERRNIKFIPLRRAMCLEEAEDVELHKDMYSSSSSRRDHHSSSSSSGAAGGHGHHATTGSSRSNLQRSSVVGSTSHVHNPNGGSSRRAVRV